MSTAAATRNPIFGNLSTTLNATGGTFPLKRPDHVLIKVLADKSEITTKGVPEGTPAWVDYLTETIYLNMEEVFKGKNVLHRTKNVVRGLSDTNSRNDRNLIYGLLNHEISHAYNSRWACEKPMEAALNEPVMMMEEIRVESKAVDFGGSQAIKTLRQSFAWLLDGLASAEKLPDTPRAIAKMWGLMVGRYRSGIAMWDEVAEVDNIARASLGDSRVDIMQEILDEAVKSDDFDRRSALGKEWNDLFPEDPAEEPTGIFVGCAGPSEEGEEGDEEGEGGGGKGDEEGDPADGGAGGGDEGDEKGDPQEMGKSGGQGGHDPEAMGMIQEVISRKKKDFSERAFVDTRGLTIADSAKEAVKALNKKPRDREWTTKKPSNLDRAHARKLARTLEDIALPSITKVSVPAMIPPGRLRSREMVQRTAQRDRKQLITATPWEKTKRSRTTTKPVIVGCMTDVSGSMSWANTFVARFAWVVATAGIHVNARTAALTFGNDVNLVTRPGEHPKELRIRGAMDSTESFNRGAAALDGILNLRKSPNAAKVLFIVSDGYFVGPNEVETACMWVKELTKAGTTIVWVSGEGEFSHYAKAAVAPGAIRNLPVDSYSPDFEKLFNSMQKTILDAARASK